MRCFLLFSHALTAEQAADAREAFGVNEFAPLPTEWQAIWSDVPPDADYIADHLLPLLHWLSQQAQPGDVVLIQGDFGAVYLTVKWALQRRLIPVYATTRRDVVETTLPDGSIQKQSRFRHIRFRRYEP